MIKKHLIKLLLLGLLCNLVQSIIVDSFVKPLKDKNRSNLGLKTDRHRRNNYEDDDDDEPSFVSNRLPFVDNEVPATARPYRRPGDWATPAPDSGIDLGFTPVQTYLQVRRTNTVRHLPRSDAIKEASSEDEVLNAHRLKEVLRTKKIQEVYSEEGYHDSAYDHADQERHAEHDEGFSKHKDGHYRVKDPVQHVQDVADAESQVVSRRKPKNQTPKVSRKRVETSSTHMEYMNGEGKRKGNEEIVLDEVSGKKEKRSNNGHNNDWSRSRGTKRDFASKKEEFWNFPSSFEDLRGSKWNHLRSANRRKEVEQEEKKEKKSNRKKSKDIVKPDKVAKKEDNEKTKTEISQSRSLIRIPPVPTFGYIHSLTDAHYGSLSPANYHQTKPIPSHVINLTESFETTSKEQYTGFEPKKISKRNKRQLEEENERYKNTDEYEKELSQNLDEQEKNIIGSALKNLGIKSLNERYPVLTTPPPPRYTVKQKGSIFPWKWAYDGNKYPYYNSKWINPFSPLRYASHPREFPVKSGYGMEFYDNKDRTIECDPIDVSLEDAPKENSTYHLKEQPGEKKRIVGLGDKIRCLKIKYFGEDPLDSPFFKESMHIKSSRPEVKYRSSEYIPKIVEVEIPPRNDSKSESSENSVNIQRWPPAAPHSAVNKTEEDFRVIPVQEFPEITTASPIMGMKPPPMSPYLPLSLIRLPQLPKPAKLMKKIKYKYNCLQPITKMTITERSDEDVLYDCQDVTLVKTMRDGNPHIQIIPKRKEKSRRSNMIATWLDEVSLLRAGEAMEGSLKRRRRQAPSLSTRRRSQLFPNKSLLDKLIKRPTVTPKSQNRTSTMDPLDLGDRSPEEVNVVTTTRKPDPVKVVQTTTTAATTTKQAITESVIKFQPKPLSRLSGTDFLTKYHKNKGSRSKGSASGKFWDVESTTKRVSGHTTGRTIEVQIPKEEKPKTPEPRAFKPKFTRTPKIEERSFQVSEDDDFVVRKSKAKRDESGSTPVLLYIVDQTTGQGQWVREDSTTESSFSSTTSPTTQRMSERQIKNENARKNFFSKKLKKVL